MIDVINLTKKYDSGYEGGAAAFVPVLGIMAVFVLSFVLRRSFGLGAVAMSSVMAATLAVLTLLVFALAVRWFNRELLVNRMHG